MIWNVVGGMSSLAVGVLTIVLAGREGSIFLKLLGATLILLSALNWGAVIARMLGVI